jgi:hypothetical protein
MRCRRSIGLFALAALLSIAAAEARAHDDSKYPDWTGQWRVIGGNRWDPTKPEGRSQQPPLTPEYQAIFQASLADQEAGGPGNDLRFSCYPAGMPRMMTAIFAIEFIIFPDVTHILFENHLPRRIYTDGRDWPKDIQATFAGYSIGNWVDPGDDGRYHALEVETRGFKGPRAYEPSGLPLHEDNETVIKERISLDRANPDILHNEITTLDHALTRPWTVTKNYRRARDRAWLENNCTENNPHVLIGKEAYYLSAEGYLMPAKKEQPPPDLRYFDRARK